MNVNARKNNLALWMLKKANVPKKVNATWIILPQ